MKSAALGDYLLYARAAVLVNGAATVNTVSIASATDTAVFRVLAKGDATAYPPAPQYEVAVPAATLDTYRNFVDPELLGEEFTFAGPTGTRLTAAGTAALAMTAAGDAASQRFRLEEVTGCAEFPEADDLSLIHI